MKPLRRLLPLISCLGSIVLDVAQQKFGGHVTRDFAPGLHRRVMPLPFFVKGIEQKLGHVNDPRACPAG